MATLDWEITLPIATEWGEFRATYAARGLRKLTFPERKRPHAATKSSAGTATVTRWHRLTNRAVTHILAGRQTGELPPLDWAGGTDFQRAVWRAMREISTGQTRTYGELARVIGRPRAVRAVGGACGANPIPLLVPCHRVLAAGGKLGGFSGGLKWKRRLLACEHVKLRG
jgi:O-6-methylguanine DNA methyltransferase